MKAKTTQNTVCGIVCGFLTILMSGCGDSSDRDLKAAIKRALDRKMDFPLEVTEVSVNWETKSSGSAVGRFSATTRTTERFYESVPEEYSLRKLGIAETYEREFRIAMAQAADLNLPKPHLAFPPFVDVLMPKGANVLLGGNVELVKFGNADWQVDELDIVAASLAGKIFVRESELKAEVCRVDDPSARTIVEAIVQNRKDFIDKVEQEVAAEKERKRIADEVAAEAKRLADEQRKIAAEQERLRQEELAAKREEERVEALKRQKEDFEKFCKPGEMYEGYYDYSRACGIVRVVFANDYMDSAKETIGGKIIVKLREVSIERPFEVSLNAADVAHFPVAGTIDISRVLGNRDHFFNTYKLNQVIGRDDFMKLVQEERHVAIRFADGGMDFCVGSPQMPSKVPLNLKGVAANVPGVEGIWRQYVNGEKRDDFIVKFNAGAGLYEMSQSRTGNSYGKSTIYDIRYDGQAWSFYFSEYYDTYGLRRIALTKVNANLFEGTSNGWETETHRWERIGGGNASASMQPSTGGTSVSSPEEKCAMCKGQGRVVCSTCQGAGTAFESREVQCGSCNGTGSVKLISGTGPCISCRVNNVPTGKKTIREKVTCSTCNGKKIQPCSSCNDAGKAF